MIVTDAELRAQVGLTDDAPPEDLVALSQKGAAAQGHIERLLGFSIEATFGGPDQEPMPEPLREAVLQLAAWWFANRETAIERGQELPFGVSEIINEYRDWSF